MMKSKTGFLQLVVLFQGFQLSFCALTFTQWSVTSGNNASQATNSPIVLSIQADEDFLNSIDIELLFESTRVNRIVIDSSGTVTVNDQVDSNFIVSASATNLRTVSLTVTVTSLLSNYNEKSIKFNRISPAAASTDFLFHVKACSNISNTLINSTAGAGCTPTLYNLYNCATTFVCAEGFTGSGTTLTCQNNATWDGDGDVTCEAITCDANSLTLKHNNTVIDGTTQATYQYNETATVKCNDNYISNSTNCRCYGPNTWICDNTTFKCEIKEPGGGCEGGCIAGIVVGIFVIGGIIFVFIIYKKKLLIFEVKTTPKNGNKTESSAASGGNKSEEVHLK